MAKAQTYPHWETRLLVVVTAVLVAFGIAAVWGTSGIVAAQQGQSPSSLAIKQLLGALIGTALVMAAARTGYDRWHALAWWGVGGATPMLLLVMLPLPISVELNGSRRWLSIFGLTFQPSEFAKLAIVIWTARLAAKKAEQRIAGTTQYQIRTFKRGVLPFVAVAAPAAALITIEPDLSTAVLFCLLVGIILFTAGAKIGHFLIVGSVGVALYWWAGRADYQFERIKVFVVSLIAAITGGEVQVEAVSWQIDQSILGFGSGGFIGPGFGQGLQKLGYLPYAYSDFIFSAIGEELGFVGACAVIVMFGLFIVLGLRIAATAPDRFASLLAVGITAMIGVTAILHMAVTIGLGPTTGLPLPFISYGRSNLLVSMAATGILLNIGMQRRIVATPKAES